MSQSLEPHRRAEPTEPGPSGFRGTLRIVDPDLLHLFSQCGSGGGSDNNSRLRRLLLVSVPLCSSLPVTAALIEHRQLRSTRGSGTNTQRNPHGSAAYSAGFHQSIVHLLCKVSTVNSETGCQKHIFFGGGGHLSQFLTPQS